MLAKRVKHGFSAVAVIAKHPDFDQTMGVEPKVDFFQYGRGGSVVSNHDHRVQMVRVGAVNFAFCRGKLYGWHDGYYLLRQRVRN